MLDRLLLAFGLIVVGWVAYRLFRQLQLRRTHRQSLGLPGYQPGTAAILYFTAPGCGPCRTVQKPALAEIQERYGSRVEVLEFDATAHPQLADSWGVLSVPTTFIIDRQGRPRGVNHGVAPAHKLERQLSDIDVEPPADQNAAQPALAPSREI